MSFITPGTESNISNGLVIKNVDTLLNDPFGIAGQQQSTPDNEVRTFATYTGMINSGLDEDALCKVIDSFDDPSPETAGIHRTSHYSFDFDTGVFTRIASGDQQLITYIAENVDGVQTYINEEGIPFEIKKTYDLPAPQWEEIDRNIYDIMLSDSNYVIGDKFGVRVPLLDKALLASGQVFVEYGRIKRTYNRGNDYGNRVRGSKIEWYSPRYGQTQTRFAGYSSGSHNQITVDRPNLFQVTQQGFLSPELPRNAFYRMVSAAYYNGDHSDDANYSFITNVDAPHMTGGRIHKIPSYILSKTYGDNRRPQNAQLKTITHQDSEWYARLVIIKDGKVIQQGPHSEPLFLSWTGGGIYWNEFERKYSTQNNGSGAWKANITIGHKYKE